MACRRGWTEREAKVSLASGSGLIRSRGNETGMETYDASVDEFAVQRPSEASAGKFPSHDGEVGVSDNDLEATDRGSGL